MKRIMVIACVLATLCLTACGAHEQSVSVDESIPQVTYTECNEMENETLGRTSLDDKMGNEEVLAALNTNFERMIEAGTPLFSCLSGITELDVGAQYEHFLEADKCTAIMEMIYEEIIANCTGYEELNTVLYQTKLLKHACPPAISGSDATSLANQAVLYQLYLQQLSSGCSYLSESLDYLVGNREQPEEITFFEEVPEVPVPDSVMYGISYHSKQNAPGNIQYMYLLGDSETDAMLNYTLYLSAIQMDSELKVDISDSMAMVSLNGNMVSLMMAGNDPSLGYFLAVSFQQ